MEPIQIGEALTEQVAVQVQVVDRESTWQDRTIGIGNEDDCTCSNYNDNDKDNNINNCNYNYNYNTVSVYNDRTVLSSLAPVATTAVSSTSPFNSSHSNTDTTNTTITATATVTDFDIDENDYNTNNDYQDYNTTTNSIIPNNTNQVRQQSLLQSVGNVQNTIPENCTSISTFANHNTTRTVSDNTQRQLTSHYSYQQHQQQEYWNDESDSRTSTSPSAFPTTSNHISFTPNERHGYQHQHQHTNTNTNTTNENEHLLGIAFVSFSSFAIVQMVFAFIAQSQSMKGDSAAMLVDSVTYLFNYVAEKLKQRIANNKVRREQQQQEQQQRHIDINPSPYQSHNNQDNTKPTDVDVDIDIDIDDNNNNVDEELNDRKLLLQLEIIPPLLSVVTLLVITIIVMDKAVRVLWIDVEHDIQDQIHGQQQQHHQTPATTPNMAIMLFFSSFNLLLDMVNVFFFAKAQNLLGYTTVSSIEETDTTVPPVVDQDIDDHHRRCHRPLDNDDFKRGDGIYRNDNDNHNSFVNRDRKNDNDDHTNETKMDENKTNSRAINQTIPSGSINQTTTTIDTGTSPAAAVPVKKRGSPALIITTTKMSCTCDTNGTNVRMKKETTTMMVSSNLNMCSAYTHVIADTIRSLAVIAAAVIVLVVKPPNISAEEADAIAAIVVSLVIVASLIPLFRGLYSSIHEYYELCYQPNLIPISQNDIMTTTSLSSSCHQCSRDNQNIGQQTNDAILV